MGEGSRHESLNHNTVDGRPVDNSGNFLDETAADATSANTADATSGHRWGDENPLPEPSENADSDNPSIEELRDQIERTRADMTETVDALADKLNPETIKAQVKDATVGKLQEAAATAKDKAHDLAIIAKDKAQVLAGVATEKAHALAEVAGEKIEEAKARAAEKSEELVKSADDVAATQFESSGIGGVAEDNDDASSTRSTLQKAKRWVRDNPVPVALGVAGFLFLLARRRGRHDEIDIESYDDTGHETYLVEIID